VEGGGSGFKPGGGFVGRLGEGGGGAARPEHAGGAGGGGWRGAWSGADERGGAAWGGGGCPRAEEDPLFRRPARIWGRHVVGGRWRCVACMGGVVRWRARFVQAWWGGGGGARAPLQVNTGRSAGNPYLFVRAETFPISNHTWPSIVTWYNPIMGYSPVELSLMFPVGTVAYSGRAEAVS